MLVIIIQNISMYFKLEMVSFHYRRKNKTWWVMLNTIGNEEEENRKTLS